MNKTINNDKQFINQICNDYPYIVWYGNTQWFCQQLWIPENGNIKLFCKSVDDVFVCIEQAVINSYKLNVENESVRNNLIYLKSNITSNLDNHLQYKLKMNKNNSRIPVEYSQILRPSFFGIRNIHNNLYNKNDNDNDDNDDNDNNDYDDDEYDEDDEDYYIHFYVSYTNQYIKYFDLQYIKNNIGYSLDPFLFDYPTLSEVKFKYTNSKIHIMKFFIERINNNILRFKSNHYIPYSSDDFINMNLYISSIEETNNNKYLLKNISKKNILNKIQLMINDNNVINNNDYAGLKLDINDFYSVNKKNNLIWSSIYIINNNYITNNELYIKNSMTNDTQININNSLNRFRDNMIRDIRKKCLLKSKNVFIYFLNNKYNKSITNKIIDYVI